MVSGLVFIAPNFIADTLIQSIRWNKLQSLLVTFTLHGIKSLLDHKYRTFIDFYRRATQLYYNENP